MRQVFKEEIFSEMPVNTMHPLLQTFAEHQHFFVTMLL